MPRAKKTVTATEEVLAEVAIDEAPKASEDITPEKMKEMEARLVENREKDKPKAGEKLPDLPPYQKYFETYDGRIIIGDAKADRVWDPIGNKGKGCWVLPKR